MCADGAIVFDKAMLAKLSLGLIDLPLKSLVHLPVLVSISYGEFEVGQ
jgi:hypothetical protein